MTRREFKDEVAAVDSDEIRHHMTRALFGNAWANWNGEHGSTRTSQCDILEVMPQEMDPSAEEATDKLCMAVEAANIKSLGELLVTARCFPEYYADRECNEEYFGHYLAMHAMGTGVGLESVCDYEAANIIVPDQEFSYLEFDPEKYPEKNETT